jgi:RNA polymerase sigma-70 factor (ECF subfamily)
MERVERPVGVEELERFRPLMFSIAYRMVGEVGDAEDVVQDAFLRAHRMLADGGEIREPKAFLAEVTTRLAIDHLRSARVRRERYVGQWLPEPLVDEAEPSVEERAEALETLSMAFLVVLETLSPVERAVFLLHDVFGFDFEEVAGAVGKTPANARQIAVRARKHVEARRPRFETSPERKRELADRFLAAAMDGDVDGLVALLSEDVVMVGDGGGRAGALPEPVTGALRVARFLAGLGRFVRREGYEVEPAVVNGQPGAIAYASDGSVVNALSLDIVDGKVAAIRAVVNPDKLRHLRRPAGEPG